MPVESRDDLVKRLRDIVTGPDHVIRAAATRIESDAKRIAELEAERETWAAQALKEDDCRKYWQNRAETAERALSEERERCANLHDLLVRVDALGKTGGWRRMPNGSPFCSIPLADDIATAIRSGKPDGKECEMTLFCAKCSGEGSLYGSRYGGNDPDVYRTGKCDACDGSGTQVCEARGCEESAVGFNEDGEALCEDCLMEWAMNYGEDA